MFGKHIRSQRNEEYRLITNVSFQLIMSGMEKDEKFDVVLFNLTISV